MAAIAKRCPGGIPIVLPPPLVHGCAPLLLTERNRSLERSVSWLISGHGTIVSLHEDFHRAEVGAAPSDRHFGASIAVLIALIGVWRGSLWPWFLAAAALLLACALMAPRLLHPANRAWARLGLMLNRIVGPVIMAIVFFAVLTPAALLTRRFGRDPLRLKFDPSVASYWIERRPAGPSPATMDRQF